MISTIHPWRHTRVRALVASMIALLAALVMGACSDTGTTPPPNAGFLSRAAEYAAAHKSDLIQVPANLTPQEVSKWSRGVVYQIDNPGPMAWSALVVTPDGGTEEVGLSRAQALGDDKNKPKIGDYIAYYKGVNSAYDIFFIEKDAVPANPPSPSRS